MTIHNIIGSRKEKPVWTLDEVAMTAEEIEAERKRQALQPVPDAGAEKRNAKPEVTQPIVASPAQTNIPFWTISQVNYRGVVGNVDVAKTLLDNGAVRNQEQWAQYSELARASGEFYTPDYPLFYATLERAFDLKNENKFKTLVEEMGGTLKGIAREKWLMTLTRPKYTSSGKDIWVHNFGLSDSYEVLEDLVGSDGELPAESSVGVYQSLLGTQSPLRKIKGVFNWLNDTNSVYIWRLNQKPGNKVEERVARFVAGSGRAILDCGGYPSGTYASLGVRFVAKKI